MAMTVLIFLVVVNSCWIKFPHIFAVMYKDSLDFMLLFLWKIWFCHQSCGCCSMPTPTRPFPDQKGLFHSISCTSAELVKIPWTTTNRWWFHRRIFGNALGVTHSSASICSRYTKQLVVRLKAWLPRSCVIHHADHEAYKFTLFCLAFISKEHTEQEWQRFIWTFFWHGTRCYVGGFFCVVFKVAVQVPMGNSKGCEITNWVRLPEAEETVSQGSYSNFVFQVLLCCSHASYSTNHRLHVCTAMATNLWSTFCSEYLAGHTWTFWIVERGCF